MNADSTDTRHPHLDLQDLIAGAAGQSVAHQAREHLARCEQCQREASRWNLVAEGVRGLAADAPETAPPTPPAQAPQSRPTGRRVLAGPWRRALVVAGSAAAALVLLVGVGEATGFLHVSLNGSGSTTGTTLTAVTGCSQLELANGTLEQVNGDSLVIQTAGGQTVTVNTTASTFMSMSGSLLGDISDGASVMVRGATSDGTIKAAIVTVGQPFSAVNPAGYVPVGGTVADASAAGFILVTSGGPRIPVTTSGDTLVVIPHASPSQMRPGVTIYALGQAGSPRTLTAKAVSAVGQLPPGVQIHTAVRNCSPSSIEEALGKLSLTPIAAG